MLSVVISTTYNYTGTLVCDTFAVSYSKYDMFISSTKVTKIGKSVSL